MYLVKVIAKRGGEYLGKPYAKGDTIEVDSQVAVQLLAKKLIELPPTPEKREAPVADVKDSLTAAEDSSVVAPPAKPEKRGRSSHPWPPPIKAGKA